MLTKRNNFKNAACLVGIVIFVWAIAYVYQGSGIWEGEGEVSVFPANSISKNYRLNAIIEVTHKNEGFMGLGRAEYYSIGNAGWPDGGKLEFEGYCNVKKGSGHTECIAEDGTNYKVEVITVPEEPETPRDL